MQKHTPEFIQPQLNFDNVHPDFISVHPNALDVTGQKFSRLVALGPVARNKQGSILWLCRCDCGNTANVLAHKLQSGLAKSCGCLTHEMLVARNKRHGMYGNPLYQPWANIVRRCTRPQRQEYPRYGGRGISICDAWRHDFQAFYDHVSKLPHCGEKGYSIDRIDNDGNYEPGNLRFATWTEQNRNKRTNRTITYNGETKCLSEWVLDTGISMGALRRRLRQKWPVDKMLTQPVDNRFSHHKT